MLRWSLALALPALLLASDRAVAEPVTDDDGGIDIRSGRTFWEWLAEPYELEVQTVRVKANENLTTARSAMRDPASVKRGHAALDDAEMMLQWALGLSPNDRHLLELLAQVQSERGGHSDALATAHRLERLITRDELPRTVHLVAGRAHAAAGNYEAALPYLREALYKSSGWQETAAAIALAQVYMETHRISEAIAMLSDGRRVQSYPGTLALTLAVALDRDEQHDKAKLTLKRMAGNGGYGIRSMTSNSTRLQFFPAHDRHYFMALLLTYSDKRAEARREWAAYLAAGKRATYARRARQQLEALAKPKVSAPAAKPTRRYPPPPPRPRWRHRP